MRVSGHVDAGRPKSVSMRRLLSRVTPDTRASRAVVLSHVYMRWWGYSRSRSHSAAEYVAQYERNLCKYREDTTRPRFAYK